MSIIEGLKRTLNIAGSKIALVSRDDIYSQSDPISGEVIIAASEHRQPGKSIKLELKEFWTETRSTGKTTFKVTVYKSHGEVILEREFDFELGTEHRFPFEVQLPRNCRISTADTGWCLVVTMDIPKAIDPTAKVVLKVQPADEFLAVIKACEENMEFQERAKSRSWNRKSSKTYFRLLPPEDLKSELDYLALDVLQTEDGGVEGDLIFNLQEKSISDYLKTVIGKDMVRKPLQLSASQLFLPDGNVNDKAISQVIAVPLKEIVEGRIGRIW